MARTRAAENPQFLPKSISLDEIETGIGRLQEVLAAINDFSQDGFPYRDAARTKAELKLRECVKQIFGERSQEFQTYRHYKLRTSSKAEAAQSIAAVKGLMHILEDKKLEIQGVKPPPIVAPEAEKISPTTTAQIRVVPPTAQVAIASQSAGTASPMTVSVAMSTNLGTLASPAATLAQPSPPALKPQLPPAPAVSTTQEIRSAPVQPAQATAPTPVSMIPPAPAASATQEIRRAQAQATHATMPTPPLPAPPPAVTDLPDVPSVQPLSEQKTLALVRKVCLRLHAVARQLRLRKDSRPTVEVEDDYDLQDLLRALLKMEFDEVGTDEWTPPYAGSLPRTMLLLNREQIAIVAKKTRPGLTAKEIAEQVAADSAFYSARNRCATLFCFVYDPEGRIGSPKRLETDLTSVSDRYTVEVLVAPK